MTLPTVTSSVTSDTITIPAFSDMHVHLRQGELLNRVARYSARVCSRILVMPNTEPAITDVNKLNWYRGQVGKVIPVQDRLRRQGSASPAKSGTEVLYTFKLTPATTVKMVDDLAVAGVTAGKLYPDGLTTSSHGGIPGSWLQKPDEQAGFMAVLERMQAWGLKLCLHGEAPWQEDPYHSEADFLPFVSWLLGYYPKLQVVMEHITTAASVRFIKKHAASEAGRLAATITLQHLLFHRGHEKGRVKSDSWGFSDSKLHPHLFCWPALNSPQDREALQEVVIAGDKRFFFSSDSAPHERWSKEQSCGCAGVFSAPVMAEGLATWFDKMGCLDKLANFTSKFADSCYGLPAGSRMLTLVKQAWRVPEEYHGIVPLLAGNILDWRVSELAG